MGMKADLIHDIAMKSASAGGSKRTQQARRELLTLYVAFLVSIGALCRYVREVAVWTIPLFASFCLVEGMKPGHLQNVFAALRVVFAEAGVDLSVTCSNHALGLPRRDRSGKRRAQTQEEYSTYVERARREHEGLMHIIILMHYFGLRMKEAMLSAQDLPIWRDALAQGLTTILIQRGVKNNRPRAVAVLHNRLKETLDAVDAALAYCRENNFRLVNGKNSDLKSSKEKLAYLFRKIGMTGQLSAHSARYTYAVNKANELLDSGVPPYETLVAISTYLGHGPSRWAMILNVYCHEIRHRFDGQIRLPHDQLDRRQPAQPLGRPRARHSAKRRRLKQQARASRTPS
jgi:hypothetical protein